MNNAPPRLVPDFELPPYRFVPGQSPHPVSDPAGHQFGARPALPAPLDPDAWWSSRAYLIGFDLFNQAYYWESHEAWEGLWHVAGRKGVTADFLKGLIKLAAAGVKARAGTPRGVTSHSFRAAELWRGVARALGKDGFLGLRINDLIEVAEGIGHQGWPQQAFTLVPMLPSRDPHETAEDRFDGL